ncbi:HNH endonuclease [Tenacibaculum finnmarkense]|uniref:HNH endonuclease n=1 Tax=Tenacibaculum finnmarkense TaxID=2781243 RepID=UPI001EFB9804|nr:HNH endonuclease [Tenacibaculum finnmarkense]MCG8208166.1 HNH endonuclease [Tenacibaculum finnmarkense genomovar finnmarkense]MCG8724160.1 HNH endonuclease [Tenacibaculum finnmarkense]MCG8765877.1 HNH endonuclease [Tenacibaculum finnmarkense]MCG8778815.1 HNH endonuclease [Tenacibaculum finnmarkense]MCM8907289.1 HNH endonuclease [Tenacibaculum finnmarkense genomovar finnmarkense]
MRPIDKGSNPLDDKGKDIEFKEYSHSRKYLIDRLGRYCSYCENSINANLAVEHVQPKSKKLALELNWDNFLLACTNCNSTKGDDDINVEDYIFPDVCNSFLYFEYGYSGIVKPKATLSAENTLLAKNTIKLVGLDKIPPNENTIEWKKAGDSRFEKRLESYKIAIDYLNKYEMGNIDKRNAYIDCFSTIVSGQGFWSIWIQVFANFPEVILEIKHCINGTNKAYYP